MSTRLSVLLFAASALSTSVKGQANLSANDSASIGLMIADRVIPSLRAIDGADSTNSVCVRIEAGSRTGALMRALDSALRAKTGGAIAAPASIAPLRAVIVDSIVGNGDSALVIWHTGGGGLVRGEMRWGHHVQWRLLRRDSTWTIRLPVRGTVGDGYIRDDLPKAPSPPECAYTPTG